MLKKGKIFGNLHKNKQNLKIFQKKEGDCVPLLNNKLLEKAPYTLPVFYSFLVKTCKKIT